MRVLVTVGTRAQLVNVVPVGWALRGAGHEVALATPPDLAAAARRSGLAGTVAEITGFARRWRPDLVLRDGPGPDLGVTPVRIRSAPGPDPGGPVIDPLPACFPAPVERIAVRHVPYEELAVVPDWLRKPPRRPRVCVTTGAGLVAAGPDVEVVAVLDAAGIPPGTRVTPATRVVDRLPLDAVLPTCAALVHAGGPDDLAAVTTAVRHGVPQLVLGDLDIGAAGLPAGSDPAAALDRLLTDPAVRDGVERLAAELAARPAPADIVPDLEKLAALR